MKGSWSTGSGLRVTGMTVGVVMPVRPRAGAELIGAHEFVQARWPSGSGPGALTVRIAKFERTSVTDGSLSSEPSRKRS